MYAFVWLLVTIHQLCHHDVSNAQPVLGVKATGHIHYLYVVGLAIKSESGIISDNICTGSLISPIHVMTTASCTKKSTDGSLVVVGRKETESQLYHVRVVIDIIRQDTYKEWFHIKYKQATSGQDSTDIAVLTMKERIPKIVSRGPTYSGHKKVSGTETFKVVGWGPVDDSTIPANPLRTTMTFLQDQTCRERVQKTLPKSAKFTVPHRTVCATVATNTALVDGDFGGPVAVSNSNVIGIVLRRVGGSSGNDKKQDGTYLVLLLSEFKEFIQEITARRV